VDELSLEETTVILRALRSWAHKLIGDADNRFRRGDPAEANALLEETLSVQSLLQKFQV